MARQTAKIGKYTVVGKIAKGGMGTLYLAKHPTLKRLVILKQLTLRGGGGFIERFKREASLMIDFRDEHIVPVYDHFRAGSSYYIAMEYVDGTSLDKLIREKGQLSNEAALLIFYEICRGLKYAHDKDVIHRDIKPANILISKEGEVKLVDFGIATSKEAYDDGLTKAGMTLGTPSYMSPEQITDTRKVDNRADIYSMGVMLYEMLTGGKPFPTEFNAETINLINRGIYEDPKKKNPSIPGILKRIIKRTMNPRISRRYKDIQYLLNIISKFTRRYRDQKDINNDIKRYLSEPEATLSTSIKIGKKKTSFSLKLTIGIIILALLASGGLFLYFKGYFYEYFKNKEYGSIMVRAVIPADYYKETARIYAFVHLTGSDTEAGSEAGVHSYRLFSSEGMLFYKAKELLFKEKEGEETENNVLSTKTIYLPAGNYSMELILENQKYYKSFYLNPREIQKQDIKTYTKRIIRFDLKESGPKPISIIINAFDGETGESIYEKADISFYLEDDKKWIDWKKFNSSKKLKRYLSRRLKSGKNYSFKFKAPHYYPGTAQFYVESGLDSALVEVGLIKKPGKLVIESDFVGLEILIDNRKESYMGEMKKDFIKYGRTTAGVKEFVLPEGNYILTVKKDERHAEHHQFEITPEQTTAVKISYNTEEKKIQIIGKKK